MIRRFLLVRDKDESGISGTGIVAEGCEFTDGTAVLRWSVAPGNPGAGYPTTVHHDGGIESVAAIHGHYGNTKIDWLDD